MKQVIQAKLKDICSRHGIDILYACESGSRGWQFSSPDSDYDVRFIYLSPLKEYLSINNRDEQLSFPINNDLDIYGWDLRKVLGLIRKSNTTPFEWLQSPIIYSEEAGFRNGLWELCQAYFSPRRNVHHYLGIAKGAMDSTNGCTIKIKQLFYVLRPLLAAKWCLESNSIAPMAITPLMALLPDDIRTQVHELITFKDTAAEGQVINISPSLSDYITVQYTACSNAAALLDQHTFPLEPLDDFFINTLKRYDHT